MGPPPKLPKGRMKEVFVRLIKIVSKGYVLNLVIVFACIILRAILSAYGVSLLKDLIDDGIRPMVGVANPDFHPLYLVVEKMAVTYILVVIMAWVQSRLMINVSQDALRNLRNAMMRKMQTLSLKFFDTNKNGDLMSRYTNDIDTIRQMISQGIPNLFSSIVTIIAVFYGMVRMSWQLTGFVIICLVVIVTVGKFLAGKSSIFYVAQQKSLGKVNGYIEEMLNGQKVIKVFNHEEEAVADFKTLNEDLCNNAKRASIFANIMMPVMAQMSNFLYFFVAVFGAAVIIKGYLPITLGTLIAFLQYTKNFTNPITQVSQEVTSVVMAMAGADRVFTLIDETPEVDEGKVTLVRVRVNADGTMEECEERTEHWAWKKPTEDGFELVELKGFVEFKNVVFGYNEEKIVLNDISLYAKPGQKIAFVGHTGAGKTTITNLINRFYDVNSGEIIYDGINVNDIKKSDLRRSLGIVLQDTHLFTGTIRENIRYGRLDATDEDVVNAAKLANADYFIRHLKDGYDTVITGDGGMLSQGQRQLLSIARAAVADPPVLILDEATSSIDTRTERIVQDGMDKLMDGRTVFVIAHRLSTVRNSKAILYLENGKIKERGTHEELLSMRGDYYKLYTGAYELE
ncbi:MAG: ABC transporter ATP-binding protein [Lachnospiraceae bacterium]|nr:ABC transporter ATP-binding protein [Lachnospiraceae bacterium]